MRYFIDTEFIEDGKTIELLSIGIVSGDSRRRYYAESAEADWSKAGPWVVDNVLPHMTGDKRPRAQIAAEIREFVDYDTHGQPEFWAYFADYDWVALCQLYGTMMDLPLHWPMFCMDLKQFAVSIGNPELPKQMSSEHNALADALWNLDVFDYLNTVESFALSLPPVLTQAEPVVNDWLIGYFATVRGEMGVQAGRVIVNHAGPIDATTIEKLECDVDANLRAAGVDLTKRPSVFSVQKL